MIEDNIEFSYIQNGKEVVCTIISLIPKEENEFYVVYIDEEKDENNNPILKYGKMLKKEDEYALAAGIDNDELEYIKEEFKEDLRKLANKIIEMQEKTNG